MVVVVVDGQVVVVGRASECASTDTTAACSCTQMWWQGDSTIATAQLSREGGEGER